MGGRAMRRGTKESRESELEESRARLADLYDFAPVVYVTLDADGRIVEANVTAASYFGVERVTLVGKLLTSIVAVRDRRALREHIQRCFAERIKVESELSFSVRRRPPVTVQMISVPFFDRHGAVTGCKTALTDITALKRAQEKLQFLSQASAVLASSFDYRATLVEVAHLAVPVLADICVVDLVDDAGTTSRLELACADPAISARLLPCRTTPPRADDATAVGRAIRTRQPLLFPDCSAAALASTGEAFDHEALIRISGAQSVMVAPLVARDRVLGVITLIATESGRRYSSNSLSTASDLATHAALAIDNARLYQQAQRAIAARQDVLSFVSHDLSNPLMGILLTTDTLLRSARDNERRKGWSQIERVRRAAEQMSHMIHDLLDVASIDAGRLTIGAADHEIGQLFDDGFAMLGPLAAAKGIALRFEQPMAVLAVRCDRERVIQVLSNLVGNAIKFTPAGGAVSVSARPSGGKALLVVRDTGPGISPAVRPHIFERFWQADETANHGRGLGLFIAKSLVEAQSGSIWVDSPAAGGATFSFTLPLAPQAAAERRIILDRGAAAVVVAAEPLAASPPPAAAPSSSPAGGRSAAAASSSAARRTT